MSKKITSTIAACVTAMAATILPTNLSAATSHYERGRELYNLSLWADARQELTEARKKAATSRRGLERQNIDFMLAMCAVELGVESAGDEVLKYISDYPATADYNFAIYTRAVLELEDGEVDEAYERMMEVNPDLLSESERERYNLRIGYLSFLEGESDDAENYLSEIEEESTLYEHALYFKSYIAYEQRRYDEARRGFEALMSNEVYSPVVPFYLLQIEYLTENYDKAIEYGTSLLKSASQEQQEELVRSIAESYFRSDKYSEAIEYIDKYEGQGGKLGRAEYYLKGFSLHQSRKYKEAIPFLKLACGADDAMTQNASFHLANCYLKTNDKAGALKAFSMASNDAFNPQIGEEALFNYAKLQFELGDGLFNETINILTRYIDKYDDPKRRAVAQTLLASAYYNSRDYATAYDKIGQIKNPDAEIRAAQQKITYLRGLEQYSAANYKDAERYLEESISIGVTPKQVALASFWVGEINFLRGDYDKAVEGYNYLMARSSKDDKAMAEALFSIAYALYFQGNSTSSLDYFKRYIASAYSTPAMRADAYNRIGDINYSLRNFTAATDSYKSSIKSGGVGDNYARYQVAIILGVEGKTKEKIAALKAIVEDKKGSGLLDDAQYELGNTYIKAGEYRNAIATLESFLKLYPRSEFYAQTLSDLGVAYINANDSKSALSYYDKAIKAAPQSQVAKDAMQGVREIYVGQGEADVYFKYAESIGMEGDLNAVTRDSLSFASARGLYFSIDGSESNAKKVISSLNNYVKKYPNGYYLSDALFYLSDCYIKTDNKQSAISTLTMLGDRGNNQYSESVYKTLSKLTFDEGQYAQSAAAGRRLFEVAKEAATREEAMSHYAKATLAGGDASAIQSMSNDILAVGEEKAGAVATSQALYIKATNLRERGERSDAIVVYKQIVARESAKSFWSESRYYIIDDAHRAGRNEEAEKLIFEFADSGATDAYWLARSYILLGDIYVANGDNFQARATYQSIVDGYSSESDGIIEAAKAKIDELK
ncbi:MAG: tetratricopeptide repeat protein [Rikenellaceae bacterium]